MSSKVIQSLEWRYATKKFNAAKRLSAEKLEILKKAFNLTATSYGLQPLKMVVISDSDTKQKLVPITMNQAQVVDCSHVLVLCTETKVTSAYIKEYFDSVENIRNTPREILHSFETFLTSEFAQKDSLEIETWTAKQAYIAMGNLLTVCALEKIDACPIEGFEAESYNEFLGLKELDLKSVLVLAVGYRAEDDMFSTMKKVRRGVEKVVIEK